MQAQANPINRKSGLVGPGTATDLQSFLLIQASLDAIYLLSMDPTQSGSRASSKEQPLVEPEEAHRKPSLSE